MPRGSRSASGAVRHRKRARARPENRRASRGQFLALDARKRLALGRCAHARFALVFTPLGSGQAAAELIKARPHAWIFTSATLAVGEDFQHFTQAARPRRRAHGADPEPFDFERQGRLYCRNRWRSQPILNIPPGGRSRLAFGRIGGRTACLLFTSIGRSRGPRLLRAHAGCQRYPLLSRARRHAKCCCAASGTRQCGTARHLEFLEGGGRQGDALCVVFIDKLPFASRMTPAQGRIEGIRRRGAIRSSSTTAAGALRAQQGAGG